MLAVELLQSVSCQPYFAKMEDGNYRWVSYTMELLPGGPQAAWVERGRTARAASLHGEFNVQRPIAHDVLLGTLNNSIRGRVAVLS
jgi:hypothetical protein